MPEDPAAVEKAKEKFWGRIAVISLGVSLLHLQVKLQAYPLMTQDLHDPIQK